MRRFKVITGKVVVGKKRGRMLDFPTANIKLHRVIPEGIYISIVSIDKLLYPALTFIGSAKTFNESDYKAESYIFSFEENIYGEWISIRLLKKIRNNKKFNSGEKLKIQMEKDKQIAEKYFKMNDYV